MSARAMGKSRGPRGPRGRSATADSFLASSLVTVRSRTSSNNRNFKQFLSESGEVKLCLRHGHAEESKVFAENVQQGHKPQPYSRPYHWIWQVEESLTTDSTRPPRHHPKLYLEWWLCSTCLSSVTSGCPLGRNQMGAAAAATPDNPALQTGIPKGGMPAHS